MRTARRLCLVWGIHAVRTPEADRMSEIVEYRLRDGRERGPGRPGELIAIAAGVPFGVAGTTNLLRLERLPG